MSDKLLEELESEIRDVDFVITLAEQDKAVEKYLLGEIVRKFEVEGLKERQEQVMYEDKVAEVLELTRHDTDRINRFVLKLLQTEQIEQVLWENYVDQMGSKGLLIRADKIIEAVSESMELRDCIRTENCSAFPELTAQKKQELKDWILRGCKE